MSAPAGDITLRVSAIIRQELGIEGELDLTRELAVLGADSLDRTCIAMEVERQFHCTIPDAIADTWKTTQDIIDYLQRD